LILVLVSFIDTTVLSRPVEVAVLAFGDLNIVMKNTAQARTIEVNLGNLQLDNMEPVPSYPVVIGRHLVYFIFILYYLSYFNYCFSRILI
jgi:hypothetical protein